MLHRPRLSNRPSGLAGLLVEFLLVLSGVLIALQVNNWNTARLDRERALNTLALLRDEVAANVAAVDGRLQIIEGSEEVIRNAFLALESCDASPEAEENLGTALGSLTGAINPSLVDSSLQELARQGRSLDLLSKTFRGALNTYSGQLSGERSQLDINYGLMWNQHVVYHPAVLIDLEGGSVLDAKFKFDQPLETLCQDTSFFRRFAMTQVWHQSAKYRLLRFRGYCEEFLAVIDRELAAKS